MKKILLTCSALLLLFTIKAQAETITFATEATYPPFESISPSGDLQGFDIDIIHALCTEMKADCVIKNQAFESLIPGLQLNKFDAIFGALNITPERAKQVAFTVPYYKNSVSIVAEKSQAAALEKSLVSKKIGVQSGTTLAQYLNNKYHDNVKVNTYASEQSAFLDLTAGRIDAVMGDTPLILQWLKDNGKDKYVLVGQPIVDDQYFGQGYGIAVNKSNTALLQKLNTAIAAIKGNGAYQKIVDQYFKVQN